MPNSDRHFARRTITWKIEKFTTESAEMSIANLLANSDSFQINLGENQTKW